MQQRSWMGLVVLRNQDDRVCVKPKKNWRVGKTSGGISCQLWRVETQTIETLQIALIEYMT